MTDVREAPIVLIAAVPYEGHQLYDQRLARALKARGRDVVYVEPGVPIIRVHRWHRGRPRRASWTSADGIAVLSPSRPPGGTRPILGWLTGLCVALSIIRHVWLRNRHAGVIATAAYPTTMRVLRFWRRVVIVKDDYAAGSELTGQSAASVLRRRRAVVTSADEVAVVSPTLRGILLRDGVRSRVVPAGCRPRSGPRPELPDELFDVPGPRAAFIGMLSDRIDFEILRAVVDAGWTLVLVGRRQFRFTQQQAFDHLMASGRVVELGEREPDFVAAVVAHCHVGLVPYTMSDFNLASFPLKTLEYFAEGTPVLATALPGVLWLDTPAACVVSGPEAVPEALRGLLEPERRENLSGAAREVAERNTWAARAAEFEQMLRMTS